MGWWKVVILVKCYGEFYYWFKFVLLFGRKYIVIFCGIFIKFLKNLYKSYNVNGKNLIIVNGLLVLIIKEVKNCKLKIWLK